MATHLTELLIKKNRCIFQAHPIFVRKVKGYSVTSASSEVTIPILCCVDHITYLCTLCQIVGAMPNLRNKPFLMNMSVFVRYWMPAK
jgi:hypothetical protein